MYIIAWRKHLKTIKNILRQSSYTVSVHNVAFSNKTSDKHIFTYVKSRCKVYIILRKCILKEIRNFYINLSVCDLRFRNICLMTLITNPKWTQNLTMMRGLRPETNIISTIRALLTLNKVHDPCSLLDIPIWINLNCSSSIYKIYNEEVGSTQIRSFKGLPMIYFL